MPDPTFTLRTLAPRHVGEAIMWAAEEGWNPGSGDRRCFMAADPDGFLGGFIGGEMVSSISVVKYGLGFGFLGFYIVRPGFRGQGYGLKTWNAGLEYLEGRNIGLDGVVGQQENYRKSGFELAYRNIRYQGTTSAPGMPDPSVVELANLPLQDVIDYDREYFPDERAAFIECWIQQFGAHALGIVGDDGLRGYGVIRPCREGYKIGPLFAESGTQARTLFQALCGQIGPNQVVYLDTPEPNSDAVTLAEENRMIRVFETARMYNREIPVLPLQKIFGVTTFELG